MFLTFCQGLGKGVEEITREDLEAFIEHEQDRGLNISTVRTRMASITAFLHFLMEQDVIPGTVLKRKIKLRLPDTLPRAMNPSDVPKLLSGIDTVRDRALILLLLRTGIRIGEALGLTLNDLDMRDRKVHLYRGREEQHGQGGLPKRRCPFCAQALVCPVETQRRHFSFMDTVIPSCPIAQPVVGSPYISERQGLTTKGTRSTV